MLIVSNAKNRSRNAMAKGSEMTTTGDGDVNSGDAWVPNTVTYRLATLTISGGRLSV